MARAIRTQVDGLEEEYSRDTGLDCSDMPDTTRQEFKDETDVNKVLQRYGVDGLPRKPEYSAVDYDLDLQKALESIREAESAISKLPPSLKAKYPMWERLLDGAYSGNLQNDLVAYHEKLASDKAIADAAAVAASAPKTPIG